MIAVSALLLVLGAAASGDDDDDAAPVNTTAGSVAASTDAPDSDSGENESSGNDDDVPTIDEVGRADFTHTIVAGDFLRSIADTYDVEIDDIVAANQWDDGRDHLLLPGDEIYLPPTP